ncbi:MAG: TlpA family protein disulfide reductase [Solirubrobacterales bacterium]|nr:TlpA family protein disulfide reductase [Solirubrobacterales bacterium]
MSRKTLLLAAAAVALVAVVVLGLSQTGTDNSAPKASTVSLADAQRRLAGSPPELAALHEQANQLLPGGRKAILARIDDLKGRPVVINKWASWCGPCRFEFPFFQEVSARYGKRVAFVGLNSGDNDADAAKFLKRFPVSFPSYTDPNEKAALALKAGSYYPTTVFLDADGKQVTVHQGNYKTEQQLVDAVERYALGRG